MKPGPLLELVRRRRGLTQSELARRAGTSQPVISAYERGHRDPSYETLRRLLAAGGAELRLDVVTHGHGYGHDQGHGPVTPPADLAEHGRRLLDVLSLVDAIPARRRAPVLDAPRMISVR